jgi:hypothetical protein
MAQLIKRPWTKGDPSNLRCAKCIGIIGDKKNVCKICSFTFCNNCFNESYCYLCVPYVFLLINLLLYAMSVIQLQVILTVLILNIVDIVIVCFV